MVAHELGHAKDGDVLTGTLLGALGAAAAVVALYLLGSLDRLLRRAGVDSIGEPRAVALLLAAGHGRRAGRRPGAGAVSRRIEARADAHALAADRRPGDLRGDAAPAGRRSTCRPRPARSGSTCVRLHPSTVERMAAARAYAAGER